MQQGNQKGVGEKDSGDMVELLLESASFVVRGMAF